MRSRDPLGSVSELIPRVYAYVAYRVGPGPDAEDITSEVFERALRYRRTYDREKGEPLAWLIGIARYCVNSSGARSAHIHTDEIPEEVSSEADDAAATRLDVQNAVASLDRRGQELIALRYGADLTARQIAGVLGMKTNAVEVALHRTLADLREILAQPVSAEALETTRRR